MSTQLNLGASYLVNDFYQRFLKPEATQKELVWAGRWFTVLSTVLGLGLGLMLTDAGQAFNLLLLLGAGTGLIYILRWFWWRINAYTEIVAMISSLVIATYLTFIHDALGIFPMEDWLKIIVGAVLTTVVWVVATFFTPPDDDATLREFYRRIKPGGSGWDTVLERARQDGDPIEKEVGQLPLELGGMLLGCIAIYATLFATGFFIYGETGSAIIASVVAVGCTFSVLKLWPRLAGKV